MEINYLKIMVLVTHFLNNIIFRQGLYQSEFFDNDIYHNQSIIQKYRQMVTSSSLNHAGRNKMYDNWSKWSDGLILNTLDGL